MTFTTKIIRPLINKCSNYLCKLLKQLSQMQFIYLGIGKPLLVQNMNQILKIIRNTEDKDILKGASIALSTSKFISSAGVDLIRKLLLVDNVDSIFSTHLFRIHEINTISSIEGKIANKEAKIIENVARTILKEPQVYSFRTVCIAAKYLAENIRVNHPPLLTIENELKLHI